MDESDTDPAGFLLVRLLLFASNGGTLSSVTTEKQQRRSFSTEVESLGGDLAGAMDAISFPAYVIDREGRVRALNAASIALFGDARGKLVANLVSGAERDDVRVRVSRKLLRDERTDFETTVLDKYGELIPVEVSSVSLHGRDGSSIVGVFGMLKPLQVGTVRKHADYMLSPREQEVLAHLTAGCSTSQMAVEMGIARETVRNHVRRLLAKLGVHSRIEAVALARREHLVHELTQTR